MTSGAIQRYDTLNFLLACRLLRSLTGLSQTLFNGNVAVSQFFNRGLTLVDAGFDALQNFGIQAWDVGSSQR